ncbi:type II toxin-antitoxin system VapC family toxin [Candidatus Daviesbacteria bacterium]|nr:type II toxin-antitoxin system VapC family toxin [Candidatus Daviesbacteria bacterium]
MICIDASLAAKWVFAEELQQQAEALYQQTIAAGERIVAPPLLPIEVTNIVRQRMRRAKPPGEPLLSLVEAKQHLDRFLAFLVELQLPPGLHQRALELAHAHGLAAAYDAHYIALAQMLGCEFWTADRNLMRAVQEKLPFVKWIGDYADDNDDEN